MTSKTLRLSFAASSLAMLLACSQKPSEPPPAPLENKENKATEAPKAPEAPAPAAPAAAPPSMELPAVPEGAKVFFEEPKDGAKIEGPLEDGKVKFTVKMGAEKIEVKPAGQVEAGSGHHHLLIDVEPTPKGVVVTKDDKHLHFGKGQTETEIALTPGEHTLRLQFADGIHRSYGPQLSAEIKVDVEEAKPAAAPGKKGKTKRHKKKHS